jgi:DNA adenine methylase
MKKESLDILSEFPENQKEMIYCEPFCGNCNIFFKKEESRLSILNDPNPGISSILLTLQNNKKEFLNKIKKYKINKTEFKKIQEEKNFKNEIEKAKINYILHRFSRGGLCKTFHKPKIKKEASSWDTDIENFELISNKLACAFVFNKPPIEIIKTFDCDDVLLFCNLPLWSGKHVTSAYKDKISEQDHIEISNALIKFNGKIVLTNLDSNLYKKIYKSFNRKKIKNKKEYIWKNF